MHLIFKIFTIIFIAGISQLILQYTNTDPNIPFYVTPNLNDSMINFNQYAPVIGVLSQPLLDQKGTFIASSYIKFIESGGGRVIPLKYDMSIKELKNITRSLNGILLPGGNTNLHKRSLHHSNQSVFFTDYGATIKYLVDIARVLNDEGIYFPIFGICLGMEGILLSLDPKITTLSKLETFYTYIGPLGEFSQVIGI